MTATAAHTLSAGFELLYPGVRHKEGRVYSDDELLHLPDIASDHPHFREWKMRKESCKRLKHYFEKKSSSLNILEVGCGNGWLARHLASIPGSTVTGIDIHCTELLQASRVFNHIPNLQFVAGSIHAKEIENTGYDYIVFAASIQYFSSVKDIINPALGKLKTNGEIHIIDSVFYNPGEINSAKERTATYYRNLGFPEMTEHYFHHSINDLNFYRFKILYNPSFINRLTKNKNPFPWLCIKKQ